MPACVMCHVENVVVEICPHHHNVFGDDWAAGNRAFCNWLHRGVELPRLSPEERDDNFWTQAYVNDAA